MRIIVVLRWIFIAFVFTGASSASALCIKGAKANLRDKPSSRGKISWVVGRNMPLVRLRSKGNWVQVADLEGVKHWVFASLLTQKFQCAVIKSSKANIRTGPGTNYRLAEYRTALKYDAFRRVEQQGSWYRLSNDTGKVGWVHKSAIWLPIKTVKINY